MKPVLFFIQASLVALCFWWLSRDVDWPVALEHCAKVNPTMLIVIFVQRFTPYAFLGLRLSTLFTGRVSPWTGFKASVLCVGCNAVLPARMGELVKIVWLRACGAISYSTLCGGVFLERLLDVSTLLCLALVFALPQLNKTVVLTLAAGVGGAVDNTSAFGTP